MTAAVTDRPGVRHLDVLARQPRPAGSAAEAEARGYSARTLVGLGFDVREAHFRYSTFPGRYATSLGGALFAAPILLASLLALSGSSLTTVGMVLAAGVVTTVCFARQMLGDGVLTLPWLRAEGINLVATRAAAEPTVWLVAHLDSKSQPVPSAFRIAGIAILVVALVLAGIAIVLTLLAVHTRIVWMLASACATGGALPVIASGLGSRSDGAVDNASGVAAVLVAAALLERDVSCGVLLSSAEELGLAGARAWARCTVTGSALNCDGVDDDGEFMIMFNGSRPRDVVSAVCAASERPVTVRRMPLGLLTDSTALADAGWNAVTVSRGSLATLRRIHTQRDSLASLRGTSIDDVAIVLARAAKALAS